MILVITFEKKVIHGAILFGCILTKNLLGGITGRKKRSVTHAVTIEVTVDLADYDFLENGTYDNDTGNTSAELVL